jgi:hypothetical protein
MPACAVASTDNDVEGDIPVSKVMAMLPVDVAPRRLRSQL